MSAPATYRLINEDEGAKSEAFTLEQLLAANEDAPLSEVDVEEIEALDVGGFVVLLGGTGASLKIERVS